MQLIIRLTRKGVIPASMVFSLLLILLASVDSNAQKMTLTKHDEWIQSNIQDKSHTGLKVEVLKSGDTAGFALNRLGFTDSEAVNIIRTAKPIYSLKNIYAGHKLTRSDEEGVTKVTYQISAEERLVLTSNYGEDWKVNVELRKLLTRLVVVEGTIQDSLFYDAAKAGLEDSLTIKLVDMFAWDIDFTRDLRKNDSFKVMFEETFDDSGKRVGTTILAAEFINRGQVYTGFRYENKNGTVEYYSEEGRNLRKTYLRSPVKYSRISSRFKTSRKHPVLGYTRAHRGVDYAAKTGTPIRAVGDGKVVYKGWKGGYGRYVEILHSNGIHRTAYAHMRRYGKNIAKGVRVTQGQILGYVGMSGLATGPHLHFEFKSRGRAVNPLKIKHKSAHPIPEQEMTSFRVKTKNMLRKMALQNQPNTWG